MATKEVYSELGIADVLESFDAQDASQLFTDTGATTAVTAAGQNVKAWRGAQSAVTLTEATHPPKFDDGTNSSRSINGKPTVYGDVSGVTIATSSTLFGAGWDNAFTLGVVHKGPSALDAVVMGLGNTGAWLQNRTIGTDWRLGTAHELIDPLSAGYDGPQISIIRYDGRQLHYTVAKSGTINCRADLLNGATHGYQNPTYTGLKLSGGTYTGGMSLFSLAGGFNYVGGCIGAALLVNRYIDDYEYRDLMDYWAGRWSIGTLPFTIWIGDSLTDGSGTTAGNNGTSPPEQLQTLYGSAAIVERNSYPGRQMGSYWQEQRDVRVRSWPRSCAGQQTAILMTGYNDLLFHTEADCRSAITRAVASLIADGFAVVLCTVPYGLQDADNAQRAKKDTHNAWRRASYESIGAVALADLVGDSRLGSNGCWSNATYYQAADQIHQTPAGATVITGLVKSANDAAMAIAARAGFPLSFTSASRAGIY